MPITIAVDFDGVLHGYSRKWADGSIYDGPKPGAAAAMQRLLDLGLETVIYSTRCYDRTERGEFQPHQREQVAAWLERHQIPYTRIHDQPGKPLCVLFIDDNAYRFHGDWDKELPSILGLLSKYIR